MMFSAVEYFISTVIGGSLNMIASKELALCGHVANNAETDA